LAGRQTRRSVPCGPGTSDSPRRLAAIQGKQLVLKEKPPVSRLTQNLKAISRRNPAWLKAFGLPCRYSERSSIATPAIEIHRSNPMTMIQHSAREGSQIGRFAAFLYGLIAYTVFVVSFLYAVGFVEGLLVPKTIDTGADVTMTEALVVDLLLLLLFAVQHSVMARKQFKRWWTKFVPASVERSTYVLFASLALALLLWQWRPPPRSSASRSSASSWS
jgi:hypothetical protein